MKKTLLAFALLAGCASAFAQTAPKKASGARADGCAGMAAAKCDKSMMTSASMADMPACCRARMAAAKAAKATPTATASAQSKVVVKSL